jgi:hypothetical protein
LRPEQLRLRQRLRHRTVTNTTNQIEQNHRLTKPPPTGFTIPAIAIALHILDLANQFTLVNP